MLTVADLQAHLDRLSFQPGWAVEVYEGRFEGPHVRIAAVVANSYAASEPVELDIHSMLPPMPSLDYFEVWLEWRLARVARHEVREWFKRDGRPVFDPHAPNADQDR